MVGETTPRIRVLSESTALALPYAAEDEHQTIGGLAETAKHEREKEIRIGIGPLTGEVPARVIGYAACIAKMIHEDPAASHLLREPCRITIFSSAPKAGFNDPGPMLTAAVALGGALKLAGIEFPIVLDIACADREVDEAWHPELDPLVANRIEAAAKRHGGSTDYAFEHAANSMFGDLADPRENVPLRITIGGETEAIYWSIRMGVRAAARADGVALAPALGLILRGVVVPWYYPVTAEPPLRSINDADAAIVALARAANPRDGGNTGLKKEARAMQRFVKSIDLGSYPSIVSSPRAALRYAEQTAMILGPRLKAALAGRGL